MTIRQHWKTKTIARCAKPFAFLVLVGAQCLSAFAVDQVVPRISNFEKEDFRASLSQKVIDAANGFFASQQLQTYNQLAIKIDFKIDEEKLKNESLAFFKKLSELQNDYSKLAIEKKKALIREITQAMQPSDKDSTSAVRNIQSLRLGMFNIDLKDKALAETLARPWNHSKDSLPTISVDLGDSGSSKLPEFKYHVSDYISSLKVDLSLPDKLAEKTISDLKASIFETAGLKTYTNSSDSISVHILEAVGSRQKKSWVSHFFDPNSGAVWTILSPIIIGLFLILSGLILTKGIVRIASTLLELKPKENASEVVEAEFVEGSAGVVETETDQTGQTFDLHATAQALTSDMQHVRQQFSKLIDENTEVVAELLGDMFLGTSGLNEFKHLLNFIGYSSLKKSMDLLSSEQIDSMRTFLEDEQSEPASLLRGVEIAQQMYRNVILNISAGQVSPSIVALKKCLLKATDSSISKEIENCTDHEIAALLNVLSSERANRLTKNISVDKLKKVVVLLDEKPTDEVFASLVRKLDGNHTVEKSSHAKQQRMILRLVKSSNYANESDVATLIDPSNWELVCAAMQTRFFYSDLIFVPPKVVKMLLDKMALTDRASFIFCSENAHRDFLMALYPDKSKQREMLDEELLAIQNNQKRKDDTDSNKCKIIDSFMERLQAVIKPDLIDLVVVKKSTALGLVPPERLNGVAQASNQTQAA